MCDCGQSVIVFLFFFASVVSECENEFRVDEGNKLKGIQETFTIADNSDHTAPEGC